MAVPPGGEEEQAFMPRPPPPVPTPVATPTGPSTTHEPPSARDTALDFTLSLRALRFDNLAQRRRLGWWLLGWGLLNTLGGTLIAALQHDDEAWLAAGAITAGFGAVNALLSLGLLDRKGTLRRQILDDRSGARTRPMDVRDAELVGQLRSGQTFAMNFGLDFFYMAVGGLLYALGRATDEPALNGAGLATAVQGAWLLGFDLAGWRQANANAERVRALP